MGRPVRLSAQAGDILRVHADVVALKYQGALSGTTGRVANALGIGEDAMRRALPAIGDLHLAPGQGRIRATQAAFLRVVPIAAFTHDHIRQFSADVLGGLRQAAPATRHLALTVHGVMFGLDLDRAVRTQVEGCIAAVSSGDCPRSLERITIVNPSAEAVRELEQTLQDLLPDGTIDMPAWRDPLAPDPVAAAATPSLFDIFISFKSGDERYAAQVYDFLNARGLRVFFSRESLPRLGSDEYHAQIDLAIEQARHMVVVTSSAAHVMSQWVQYEWRLFLGERLAGRKTGNLITVIGGDMNIADLPISLRNREVMRAEPADLARLVEYTRNDVDGGGMNSLEPVAGGVADTAEMTEPTTVSGLVVAVTQVLVNASWIEAGERLRSLAIEGKGEWRLPTLDELRRIRDASVVPVRSCYWSSRESGRDEAFYMHFDDGHIGAGPKTFSTGTSALFVRTAGRAS